MKLVATVGMAGSGKSVLSNLFVKQGYHRIRFGDITDEILIKRDQELNEKNEKELREKLREQHGMAAYAKLNLEKIQHTIKKGEVIIDGLYSWEEYLYLKEHFPHLVVLAIYSPPKQRYERLVDREIRPLTKEQAKERDKVEIDKLNKAIPIAMADYTILNVGTMYDLKNNFDKFLEWLHEEDEQ